MEHVASVALAEARAAGLEVRAEADRLVVRGPRSCAELALRLLEQKVEVLALVATEDAEVSRRVAAMRPQVPPRGPIPFLALRKATVAAGCCQSCGDPLVAGRTIRCATCAQAAWLVLNQIREGTGEE